MITRASGAPLRVGWKVRAAPLAYTHALARGGAPEYVVRSGAGCSSWRGSRPVPRSRALTLTTRSACQGESGPALGGRPRRETARRTRARHEQPGARLAGGSIRLPRRRAPRPRVTPVVLAAGVPTPVVERMRAACANAVIVPALDRNRDREMRRFLGVLAACDVLVSGDTGPAHMADALGVPRVTLYGPTTPQNYAPGIATTIALRTPGPAISIRDENRMHRAGHDFFSGVTVDMVMDAIVRLLNNAPARAQLDAVHAG